MNVFWANLKLTAWRGRWISLAVGPLLLVLSMVLIEAFAHRFSYTCFCVLAIAAIAAVGWATSLIVLKSACDRGPLVASYPRGCISESAR